MRCRLARKADDAYQHGNLRAALVQAGLKLLGEGGMEKLSLRAAAQLAGVSHAAPYRHFRDKDALVAAIAEEGFRLQTARMKEEEARVSPCNLRARLTAIGVGYVAFAIENPGYFRVIFTGIACATPQSEGLQTAAKASYQVLHDLVVLGIDAGVFRKADPDELSLAAWALVHGISMLAVDGALEPRISGAAAMKKVTEGMSALLQEGLLSRTDDR